jgi:RNA polymerase subunit RPABC4/transcription elongation factor Spt4
MTQILDSIGAAIGSIFDNPVVRLGGQVAMVYWVVLWLAAAYWAFRDMQLRSENPIAPYFASAFVIMFTPVLFPMAVFVYRVIRPQEKIGEVYERNLAEESMLADIEAIRHCPSCDRRVHDDWIICPTCRTRLNRVCPNCSKLVGLDWSLCAWCGRDFERHEAAASVPAASRAPGAAADPPPSAIRTAVRVPGRPSANRRPVDPSVDS